MLLQKIHLVFALLTVGLFVYVAVTVVMQYHREAAINSPPRTRSQVLLATCRGSATILVTKFIALIGCFAGFFDQIADLVGAPEAKDFINNWVGNPKVVSAIMLIIAYVVFRARMRKSSPDPVVT